MEEKININKYFVIEQFMTKDLGLKGNELLVYAIIYNFSRLEDQYYTSGISSIMELTNLTKQSVINSTKSLVDKKYIVKEDYLENGKRRCRYSVTIGKNFLPSQKNLPSKEILPQPNYSNNINNYSSISHNTSLSINKNIENKENKKRDTINKLLYLEKKQRNFTKPSISEIQQYIEERNNSIDAEYFYNYYESNGWKVGRNPMKDWKACIRTWERNEILKNKKKNNGVVYEQI